MIRLKYWIKNFFGFSRSQVNGFIVLLILVTAMLFSEPVWYQISAKKTTDSGADKAILDSLVALWNTEEAKQREIQTLEAPTFNFFNFDPNKAAFENLVTLGFSPHLASRMIRYREKGGKFRIKSDLLKIYGVDSAFYRQLYSFISLPEKEKIIFKDEKKTPKRVLPVKKVLEKFDLNTADTAQLKKIYGIGEKLSLRIVKYRDVLGGFVNMSQLNEVYGLDSVVINRLQKNAMLQNEFKPVKINLNMASEKQLSAHPYFGKIAKAIIAYRFQHGDFKNVEDIRRVNNLDEKTIQKITPYLKVDEAP